MADLVPRSLFLSSSPHPPVVGSAWHARILQEPTARRVLGMLCLVMFEIAAAPRNQGALHM